VRDRGRKRKEHFANKEKRGARKEQARAGRRLHTKRAGKKRRICVTHGRSQKTTRQKGHLQRHDSKRRNIAEKETMTEPFIKALTRDKQDGRMTPGEETLERSRKGGLCESGAKKEGG